MMMARFRVKLTMTKRQDKDSLYFLVSQRRLNDTLRISNGGIGV